MTDKHNCNCEHQNTINNIEIHEKLYLRMR